MKNQNTSMEQTVNHHLYDDTSITMALFKDVENAEKLKQDVMNGVFQATLLKPSMIADPFQVLVAANKAVHQLKQGKMTTRNVHSEVLFCLSPTKQLSLSFQLFGMGDHDSTVYVVIINDQDGETLKLLQSKIVGTQVPVDQVKELSFLDSIKKTYQVTDRELSACSLTDSLVSRIASKGL